MNKLQTLWYEDELGKRYEPPPFDGPPSVHPYMHVRRPLQVTHSVRRRTDPEEVARCGHFNTAPTYGWVEGYRGRMCRDCQGTQVAEEHLPWPEEWDAGGSREIVCTATGYLPDLVLALARPSLRERWRQLRRMGRLAPVFSLEQATLYAAVACERCSNVLLWEHGTSDGYPRGSEQWLKCGTSCELCELKEVT